MIYDADVTAAAAQNHAYDVVLSFAGEERRYVEEVAERLKAVGVKVFYDEYERVVLWGKDLYDHLDEVYRRKGRYCVMFISQAYRDKVWTNHERQSAQARAFQESQEYVLPARFDDTEIPGIRPTVGYVDLRRMTPTQFADLILNKLGHVTLPETSAASSSSEPSEFRKPRTGRRTFNPYDEALSFISQLMSELKRRCDELKQDEVSATTFEREGRKCLRVVIDGKTIYSLDVWMGGLGEDSSVQFHGGRGGIKSSSNATNAWGDLVWDRERDQPVLAFHDLSLLSLLGQEKRFTQADFIEALWERICDAIEEA